ncbi:VOC family protein [Papillibacter cinnamivorans]|uniref:Methylmalonyl-CoA epimerase n=1 Tax=Papillibacter cinnamivorans DSM 12816 TaxID=1122930 RepID=A0A1W2CAS7_9FIRM|nr:VOC family protein [Papillibacter cinnamivorans]SMC81788.1 methylmalonyl-CoA epimerase [Papillibacter cinnamivorans DSM 12816]
MIKKLEHVGVLVKDFESSVMRFEKTLGLKLADIESVDVQGVTNKVAFFPIGDTEIELIYTTATTGLVADYIRERGEGIHHLAFEVTDIDKYYEELKERGVKFLWDGVVPGSRGTRVFFFAPEEFNGVYVEILEKYD